MCNLPWCPSSFLRPHSPGLVRGRLLVDHISNCQPYPRSLRENGASCGPPLCQSPLWFGLQAQRSRLPAKLPCISVVSCPGSVSDLLYRTGLVPWLSSSAVAAWADASRRRRFRGTLRTPAARSFACPVRRPVARNRGSMPQSGCENASGALTRHALAYDPPIPPAQVYVCHCFYSAVACLAEWPLSFSRCQIGSCRHVYCVELVDPCWCELKQDMLMLSSAPRYLRMCGLSRSVSKHCIFRSVEAGCRLDNALAGRGGQPPSCYEQMVAQSSPVFCQISFVLIHMFSAST